MNSDGFMEWGADCCINRDELTGFVFLVKAQLCPIWCLLISSEVVSDEELGEVGSCLKAGGRGGERWEGQIGILLSRSGHFQAQAVIV